MKIYLASPFFNEKELENVKIAEKILTERGFSLFSPRLNEVRTDENTQQSWWSKETFMNDKKFIDWADFVTKECTFMTIIIIKFQETIFIIAKYTFISYNSCFIEFSYFVCCFFRCIISTARKN